jgi:hypothetical protein
MSVEATERSAQAAGFLLVERVPHSGETVSQVMDEPEVVTRQGRVSAQPRRRSPTQPRLHTVILHRRLHDPATKDYIARRVSEGKTPRDAVRLLKRYLARHLYRVLDNQVPLMT